MSGGNITLKDGIQQNASVVGTNTTSLDINLIAGNRDMVIEDGEIQLAGVVSGPGGFSKLGTGRLTVTGSNTYTGSPRCVKVV